MCRIHTGLDRNYTEKLQKKYGIKIRTLRKLYGKRGVKTRKTDGKSNDQSPKLGINECFPDTVSESSFCIVILFALFPYNQSIQTTG